MWDVDYVDRLRYFINDLDTPPVWTDIQLKKFVFLSAIQVADTLQQWGVGSYVFDPSGVTITPDPSVSGVQSFGNLVVLRAANIIINAEIKKASISAGYKITDDKSSIDTSQVISSLKDLYLSYNKSYEDAIKDFKSGNRYSGSAILTPYTDPNYIGDAIPLYGVNGYCCRRY
jgi:hypothetical protein